MNYVLDDYVFQDPDLSVASRIFSAPVPAVFRLHAHPLCELTLIRQVKGVFHIEGSEYPVQPGDIILTRPEEAHFIQLDTTVPYKRVVLRFSPAVFASVDPNGTLLSVFFDRDPGKQNLYRPVDSRCAELILDMVDRCERIGILVDLMQLLQLLAQQTPWGSEGSGEAPEYRVLRYINANSHLDLTTQELCSRFFISRTQLYTRFKRATGTSVGQYIAARRMLTAQNLILQGRKPTEIFTQCGFRDYSTFYRAYVKFFGYSPKKETELQQAGQSSSHSTVYLP